MGGGETSEGVEASLEEMQLGGHLVASSNRPDLAQASNPRPDTRDRLNDPAQDNLRVGIVRRKLQPADIISRSEQTGMEQSKGVIKRGLEKGKGAKRMGEGRG